jgi:phosphoserine phosphatase
MRFDACLSSRLSLDAQGCVTGKLLGSNCWGIEKVARLQDWLQRPRNTYTLYAYGDSRGDLELLAAADHPYYRIIP